MISVKLFIVHTWAYVNYLLTVILAQAQTFVQEEKKIGCMCFWTTLPTILSRKQFGTCVVMTGNAVKMVGSARDSSSSDDDEALKRCQEAVWDTQKRETSGNCCLFYISSRYQYNGETDSNAKARCAYPVIPQLAWIRYPQIEKCTWATSLSKFWLEFTTKVKSFFVSNWNANFWTCSQFLGTGHPKPSKR